MSSAAVVTRVARKELGLFFASPVAWLFLAAFLGITLFVFFWGEAFFARNIADVRPLFEWMPLLLIFLCSALTMRMWSDERRNGTLEHVLTQPVALWQFVLGKFLACFLLLALALATTLPLPLTVAFLASPDTGPIVAGYLATLLLGSAYLGAGLLVSARTDNAIVSLMGSVALCGALYFLGSDTLTGFFGDTVGAWLRLFGTGARFDSITRGVLDLRDIYYYLALTVLFLTLNAFYLERERWSARHSDRHRNWRLGIALVAANLVLGGSWLQAATGLRLDVTEGRLYSISEPSRALLGQLREPLLIRGYFSERTHPLLAPLVPQLRDLIREYGIAGGDRVRVEIVDPASDPALEQEANEEFGIQATPFQIADRYQAALVNSYFDVLIQYGGEYETLTFGDLIEVKTGATSQPEVVLRNPEFDLSRGIRDVLYSYQAGGDLFQQIDGPVRFTGYVSAREKLPELLLTYLDAIEPVLDEMTQQSGGRFSATFVEPEAGDGDVARRIIDDWGFQPMITALGDDNEFFFYLTLEDDHQVIQIPTGNFDADSFEDSLEAALKRFSSGFTKTVALAMPQQPQAMPGMPMPPGGHSFATLEQGVSQDYSILMEDLGDGSVDSTADVLVVVAPEALKGRARFAIDQFLMRGGTVILATSPYSVELSGGSLRMRPVDSGLAEWLADKGVAIAEALVLDAQHATFPVPVIRQVGGYEFRDMQFVEYPYFLDLRDPGLNPEHPITSNLPSLTLAWPSPLEVEAPEGISVTPLLESSADAWRSRDTDVVPRQDASGASLLAPEGETRQELLGVLLQGRFTSTFDAVPEAPAAAAQDEAAPASGEDALSTLIRRSPESARLLVVASNDFLSDQVMSGIVAASGTQYLGPLELVLNAIDWSLEDNALLQIRSRAHFNRTLPPMDASTRAGIEYLNYALAIALLALIAGAWWALRRRRIGYYEREVRA